MLDDRLLGSSAHSPVLWRLLHPAFSPVEQEVMLLAVPLPFQPTPSTHVSALPAELERQGQNARLAPRKCGSKRGNGYV